MNATVLCEVKGGMGFITLNRAKALNALSLEMVRHITAALLGWKNDAKVHAVAIRGTSKISNFGGFCAGGDIRFFHQAALSGNPELEDFFTEEYVLNHLIHTYPKPYIAFMDGIVMGGGMGISQGASHRLVTERTKMAMPETNIGLFPDVGGGYFLSRCPGSTGEWLALTGETIDGATAIALGLADTLVDATRLEEAWGGLAALDCTRQGALDQWLAAFSVVSNEASIRPGTLMDQVFSMASVGAMLEVLETSCDEWAQKTAAQLRKRSPLMLHVVLEQIRRARSMTLADDLRMERTLVRHCFTTAHLGRTGVRSETVEGIRALAVDKDHSPQWSPARVEDVTPDMVTPFFVSPWPAYAHPLAGLN